MADKKIIVCMFTNKDGDTSYRAACTASSTIDSSSGISLTAGGGEKTLECDSRSFYVRVDSGGQMVHWREKGTSSGSEHAPIVPDSSAFCVDVS
jgi:hypothetical protein